MIADFRRNGSGLPAMAAGDPLLTWTPAKVAGVALGGLVVLGAVLVYRQSTRRRRRRR